MTDQREATRARLPNKILHQLDEWVAKGTFPKDALLTAVLTNDLKLVFRIGFQDPEKLGYVPDLLSYLFTYVPDNAWGYPQVTDHWEGLL
jgi:hypothetical protein